MAEEVHTGGLKKFRIEKSLKIEPELSRTIDKAYEKAEIRKAKEKRKKIIIAIIVALILLVLLFLFFR